MKKSPRKTKSERRKHPRIPFSLDVDWGETPACVHQGRVTSLSVGGCFVQTTMEIAEGRPLFIRLLLAPGSERVTEGVVWGRVAYRLQNVGVGIEFKRLPPGYKKHIEDIVEFYLKGDEDG